MQQLVEYCKTIVSFSASDMFKHCSQQLDKAQSKSPIKKLKSYLGIDEDNAKRYLVDLEENRVEGSCEWVLELPQFDEWQGLKPHKKPVHLENTKKFFCLEGIPGAGKSVIATVVIRHLETSNRYCSYFFFRKSDPDASTFSALLRSIAFQMAHGNTKIRESLKELQDEDPELNKHDSRAIWQKLFVQCIFHTKLDQPHYWVIDALDECSDYEMLITCLAKIDPDFRLQILLTSRPEREIRDLFRPMIQKNNVHWEVISTARSNADIKRFFRANESLLPRENLVEELVKKSSGNFLWATLILKRLPEADTEEDIQRIMEEVPAGMDELYNQILQKISHDNESTTTKAILTWTVCTIRPLSVGELKDALKIDIGQSILDLERTIAKRCGHLVSVGRGEKVQVYHATARAFLLKNAESHVLAIQESVGHSRLARTCLKYLVSSELKPPAFPTRPSSSSKTGNKSCFLDYACTAFSRHLVESDAGNSTVIRLSKLLSDFLKTNVLSWIAFVSRSKDLSPLINAAKHFKSYPKHCEEHGARAPVSCQQALYSWATDLFHLVAKLGKNMLNHPDAIFFLIPPICPSNSSIYKTFGNVPQGLSVKGLSSSGWDEQLASINFAQTATAVACSPKRIAVGLVNGDLILYDTATYQECEKKSHGAEIKLLEFTDTGNLLASSGREEINIWNIETGERCFIPLPSEVISLCFQDDDFLQAVTRNNHYLCWNAETGAVDYSTELQEPDPNERSNSFGRPIARARFSAELNILAIAHRSDPIWLWDLDSQTWLPRACRKHPGNVSAVNDMIFSPDSTANLLATGYSDGDLVLYNFKTQEQRATAHDVGSHVLAVSPDGRILASGNSSLIQIFELETLKLIYFMELADYQFDDLIFSSEGDRLIGIRGSQCNVWDPSVLVWSSGRPAGAAVSAPEKILTAKSRKEYNIITTIVCYPDIQYVFCGRASGAVDAYDTNAAKDFQQICKHDVEITHLACSSSILASVDISTHTSVRSNRRLTTGNWSGKELWNERIGDPVKQILLNPSGDKLLVITTEKMVFVAIPPAAEPQKVEIKYPGAYWAQSPYDSTQLVVHEHHAIHVWDWDSRKERSSPGITLPNDFRPQHDGAGRPNRPVLLKLAHELLRLKEAHTPPRTYRNWSNSIDDPTETSSSGSSAGSSAGETAFDVLGANVELVIGLHRSELLFLDADAWVCSVSLGEFYRRQWKRHFFLPFDWLSIETELVINVTIEGDVVVGKGAEVAVFHNGLGYKVQQPSTS